MACVRTEPHIKDMAITCPHCAHQNQDDTDFCEVCGAQLLVTSNVAGSQSNAAPAGTSVAPSNNESPLEVGNMDNLICSNPDCRAPLAPGDEFCFNCGTDVRNITGAKQPQPSESVNNNPAEGEVSGGSAVQSQPVMSGSTLGTIPPVPAVNGNGVPAHPAANMVGPEAQPATVPPQQPASPSPANESADSIPVEPGPMGGVAANAFGAPPAAVLEPAPPAPVPAAGTLRLHIEGPYGAELFEWKGQEILLGRNDLKTRIFPQINLDDSAASRRHLSIWKDETDGEFYAQDLESANGTSLNGRDMKAGEPVRLNNGDVLKIGTRYSIQVRIG
ncbi:MAG TPA: FHA domain-containing protein [Chloroflexia bacterium]|nr:FHA domain-containing protein [Chloroflexia bacterium]